MAGAADFSSLTDPQVQQIINALFSGQFSPQDASEIATQLTEPTYAKSVSDTTGNATVDPRSPLLTAQQYNDLIPYIGSQSTGGPDRSGRHSARRIS
jgi:hypothetical protein